MTSPNRATVGAMTPLFIVRELSAALAFYRDKLGFEVTFTMPADNPFFGIVQRDRAMLMLKDVGVDPLPNSQRNPSARWDAYVYVPDPDTLAAEFNSREVKFSKRLMDTSDGLRGFEVTDTDGYVLFFGRPRE
jgi:catechol 2,3-dioxygenase-like lactoylglutathione lyase family enzyme